MLKALNLKKMFAILLTFIMCLTLSVPTLAFADNGSSGTGDGSAGGSARNFLYWSNFSANGQFNLQDIPTSFLDVSVGGAGGSYGSETFNQSYYGDNTFYAACVRNSRKSDGFVSNTSKAYMNARDNWKASGLLHTFFLDNQSKLDWSDQFDQSTFMSGDSGYQRLYTRNGGGWLNAVWLDEDKFYIPHYYTNEKTVIVKYKHDDPDPDNEFDDDSKTPEWKYYNGKTSGTYHGITPPEGDSARNYNKKIHISTCTITKKITIVCLNKDAPTTFEEAENILNNPTDPYTHSGNPTAEYIQSPITERTETVTYTGGEPSNPQTKYRPFNLNKNTNKSTSGNPVEDNTYAKTGDNGLTSDFGNSNNFIKGYVDNKQNIDNGTPLNALDINNDTDFKVKFGNNSFGLDKYDWFTAPEPLANGTWEYSNGSYANGRVGDKRLEDGTEMPGSVGIYRFNLQLNTSISNLTTSTVSEDTASLVYEDTEEKTASESKDFYTHNDPNNGFTGGDFFARFSLNGVYTTDNEIENNNKKYWMAKYNQDRYYEYGVEYGGDFRIVGSGLVVDTPRLINPTSSPAPTVNGWNISTDGLTQRGLYVGCSHQTYYQPILTATWDVKTLAGDTRK